MRRVRGTCSVAYIRVDDHNVVTTVLCGVVDGLRLALQQQRDLRRQAAGALALGVEQIPPARVREERLRGKLSERNRWGEA